MDLCRLFSTGRDIVSIIQSASATKKKRLLPAANKSTRDISVEPTPSRISPIGTPVHCSYSKRSEADLIHLFDSPVHDSNNDSACAPSFSTPFQSFSRPPACSRVPLSELPSCTQKCESLTQRDILSSSDDEFENFLAKLREPRSREPLPDSSSSFLTDGSGSESETCADPLFYYQVDNSVKRTRSLEGSPPFDRTPSHRHQEQVLNSDRSVVFKKPLARQTEASYGRELTRCVSSPECTTLPTSSVLDFVYSLHPFNSTTENDRRVRHPSADRFVKQFKANRSELARRLFGIFNERVFDNKLPHDLEISWNSRLIKTAGQCKYLRREVIQVGGERIVTRLAQIELSPKVCTTAERVRDTLLHEACHAAVWIVDGINDGHGPRWRAWAARALRVWPKLPLVSVCHAYAIETRFTYRCTGCGQCVNRHSKSIDTSKQVCGHCRSRFELLLNTPRGRMMRPSIAGSLDKRLLAHCSRNNPDRGPSSPSAVSSLDSPVPNLKPRPPFSEFVRNNYRQVRHRPEVTSHADAMNTLGALFKSMRLAASSCDLAPADMDPV